VTILSPIDDNKYTYLRYMLSSNALVVRSIDLIWTLALGLIGELACLNGLKFRIAERILLAIDWRVRRRVPRQLRVALTKTASLEVWYQALSSTTTILGYVPGFLLEDVEKPV